MLIQSEFYTKYSIKTSPNNNPLLTLHCEFFAGRVKRQFYKKQHTIEMLKIVHYREIMTTMSWIRYEYSSLVLARKELL